MGNPSDGKTFSDKYCPECGEILIGDEIGKNICEDCEDCEDCEK